jgi:hypothetical protein
VIEKLRPKHPLAILLEVAKLARATYYYHIKRKSKPDKYAEIRAKVVKIHHENKGRYGYRRITMELHIRGYVINHKTVPRLMHEERVVCRVRMKKYRSYKGEVGNIAPNILERDFSTMAPN